MKELELLKREVRQIIGERYSLGSPIEKGYAYDIWVKFRWSPHPWLVWPLPPWKTWVHHAKNTKFCFIKEIGKNKWQYQFEDGDESLGWPFTVIFPEDGDYDEVMLTVEEVEGENKIKITFDHWDSQATDVDIGIGSQVLWRNAGGSERKGVGETKEVINPPIVKRAKIEEALPWWKKIPWWVYPTAIGGGFGLLGLYILRKTR